MIHESVFDSHLKEIEYNPIARFHDEKLVWDEGILRKQQLIEDDPYMRADHVLDALNKSNQKLNRLSDEHFDALVALSATREFFPCFPQEYSLMYITLGMFSYRSPVDQRIHWLCQHINFCSRVGMATPRKAEAKGRRISYRGSRKSPQFI